jgi:PAS domain S-box-containing protein
MADVSCRVCGIFLKTLSDYGVPPERLVEGLPVTLAHLSNPANHIPQQLYQQLSDRFAYLLETATPLPMSDVASLDINWRHMLNALQVFISIVDRQGRFLYSNRVVPGISPKAELNLTVFDLVPQQQHEVVRQHLASVFEDGEAIRYEVLVSAAGNQPARWYENYITPLKQGEGVVPAAVIVSLDITDRKGIEQELERRARLLQTVAEVGAQIKSMFEMPQMIQNICLLVKQGFGLYHAHIFLVDETGENLVAGYGEGSVGEQLIASRYSFRLQGDEHGLVPKAARERRIIISNHVQADPSWRYNPLLPDTASEMVIPIMRGDQLIGVLDVQSTERDFFSEADHAIQQLLADQIAIAIQNAQLYETIIQQWEIAITLRDIGLVLAGSAELPDLLRETLSEICHGLDYDSASIWLRDENGKMRIVANIGYERFGMDRTLVEAMMQEQILPTLEEMTSTQKALIISNTAASPLWTKLYRNEWIASYASAPIVVRDEVIGWLSLDHAHPNFYQPHHEPILEVLARQIALAVENTRLLESERSQREMAEALRDIGSVLASSLELEDILQLVLAQVARVLPYDAAAIWLDDGNGMFRVAAHFGYERFGVVERIKELELPAASRYADLMQNGIHIVPDTATDPLWIVFPGFEWVRSWVVAWIIVRDKVIGELALDHSEAGFYDPHHHKAVLEVLATQISIAVGNARLFETERRQRQEIEALQRSSLSLSSYLQLPEVLDAILSTTFEIIPARDALIYLYEAGELRFGAGIENRTEHITASPVPPRQHGLTYTVAQAGELIVIDDVHHHPFYQENGAHFVKHVEAVVGIPLKFGQRVVGVMDLTFETLRDFRQVDMNTLQLLANQASIAIENARLYTAVQDYADEMEMRVIQRTAELNQERAQLQVVLDSIGDGVIYDENLAVKYTNQMLAEMIGMPMDAWRDYRQLLQKILATSVDAEKLLQTIFKAIAGKGKWQGEVRMQRADGREFDAALLVTVVKGATGNAGGCVTVVRDISQEKALQEQKDRFIAHASHELRTPLTNIQTRLYLLKKRPDKIQDHLKVIEEVTGQMVMLAQDLLDLSRFERGVVVIERRQVDMREIIEEVVTIQQAEAESKHLRLTLDMPSHPVTIWLDPDRIRQVLTNLVTNAINYTDEHGEVAIRLWQEPDRIAVSVRDSGVGIPVHLHEQVFHPFFRVRDGMGTGTGLGLSIAREIVEAHHGSISLESVEGQGSTFTVWLPFFDTPA